jgi:hypothetical protein
MSNESKEATSLSFGEGWGEAKKKPPIEVAFFKCSVI